MIVMFRFIEMVTAATTTGRLHRAIHKKAQRQTRHSDTTKDNYSCHIF
jgi:hypothetical protein